MLEEKIAVALAVASREVAKEPGAICAM